MAGSVSVAAFLRRKPSREAHTTAAICSPYGKEVLLNDWWLIMADSDVDCKRLGVGGFTTKESRGTRCFLSAPVVKRHDAVTLQTADGIIVTVRGHLNRARTLDNGFPLKVCYDFVFGFPYYWEEFVSLLFDGQETTSENLEYDSLDAFPVTILRDLFIGNLGHHESSLARKNIFDDTLPNTTAGTSGDGEFGSKKATPLDRNKTVSTPDEALSNSKARSKRKGSKDVFVREPSTKVKQKLMQENNITDKGALTSGPVTRSRSRLIMRST